MVLRRRAGSASARPRHPRSASHSGGAVRLARRMRVICAHSEPSYDFFHDLVGPAVDFGDAAVEPHAARSDIRACSRSRRAAAGTRRRSCSAGRWSSISASRLRPASSSPCHELPHAAFQEGAADDRLGARLGEAEAACSGNRARAAESLALACVGDCVGDRSSPWRHRADAGHQALLHQTVGELRKAAAFDAAEQGGGGDATSSKKSSVVSPTTGPALSSGSPRAKPFRPVGLHQEQADAAIGLRCEHDHVGVGAVGDEGLAALDDVIVAVALGARCVMPRRSLPPLGSVMAMAPIHSPTAMRGQNACLLRLVAVVQT